MKKYRLKKDLPTFKAGETFVLWPSGLWKELNNIMAYSRQTLDKFPNILEDWFEEIKPKEPLIKDEKIRKAVRAWADALEIDEVLSYGAGSWIGLKTADIQAGAPSKIEIDCFSSVNTLTPSKVYTIAELCGEEEE